MDSVSLVRKTLDSLEVQEGTIDSVLLFVQIRATLLLVEAVQDLPLRLFAADAKEIQGSVLPDGTKGSDFISPCPYCDEPLPLVMVGGQVRRADHECEGVETK